MTCTAAASFASAVGFTIACLCHHDAILYPIDGPTWNDTTTMLAGLALLSLCVSTHAVVSPLKVQDNSQITLSEDVKVPVVLGVMSRCPDAMLCEAVWDRVLQRVGDKVDISLSFIAEYVRAL